VFNSPDCQHCSNTYLLLTIPIAIVGLVLVFLLFLLNLKVNDGTINAFILYVNIVGINKTMFLHDHHTITPLHTFISLANLDLGIQMCFYNGMDDYAKMWLQLAFPCYIISITVLLIVVRQYSITIQRLTAHRAFSVLATLFLLSFTKILQLQTTSTVLFSYSSITHLPSKHTTIVWSIDANIPLFGVKFTLLFVICLILFLILLFIIILLCTKTFLKFRIFRNILDNYQRPYKLHYWFGLQLIMRIIFFYLTFLNREINIAISIIVLSVVTEIQGMQKPFKNKIKNYHELSLMVNPLGLYVFVLSEWWIVNCVLISVAGAQFLLIVVYHILNQFCSGVIKSLIMKIQQNINKLLATYVEIS